MERLDVRAIDTAVEVESHIAVQRVRSCRAAWSRRVLDGDGEGRVGSVQVGRVVGQRDVRAELHPYFHSAVEGDRTMKETDRDLEQAWRAPHARVDIDRNACREAHVCVFGDGDGVGATRVGDRHRSHA